MAALAVPIKQAPDLQYAFTLHVNLTPPECYGITNDGEKRFIPISGGAVDGPKLQGEILPGGGDWNTVQHDGVVHVWAKYSIRATDGTMISITNAGRGRGSLEVMAKVFEGGIREGDDGSAGWYTKTFPTFDVESGAHDWLTRTCFVGNLLLPTRLGHVEIDIFEIL